MSLNGRFKRVQNGFTLMEIVIGMTVFALVLSIITGILAPQSTRSIDPIYQVRATEIAQSMLNEMSGKLFDEYADRNAQYKWFLAKLGLRKVKIQDYSRLNFIKTTLSKRKLNWFVEQGLVEGWNDPRFPTVQGILRRGMLVSTLIEFMMEQGPSKNTNLMEWDKIWSLNRKNIDPIALKFTAISKDKAIKMTITNLETDSAVEMIPLHQKNPEAGKKPVHKKPVVIVENEDGVHLKEGEKIVLLKWGIFLVKKAKNEKDEWDVQLEYLPEDKDFKTPPKLTWLPHDPSLLIDVNLIEYGHLLLDDKPDADFEKSVNKNSKFETAYYGESFLQTLQEGCYVQFERRCYAILDRKEVVDGDKLLMHFILIPDGKTKSMGFDQQVDAKEISKGVEDKGEKKDEGEEKELSKGQLKKLAKKKEKAEKKRKAKEAKMKAEQEKKEKEKQEGEKKVAESK